VIRVQRQRTKGYRLPPGSVYVGRPSRWGNPYHIERYPRLRRWLVVRRDTRSGLGSFASESEAVYWAAKGFGLVIPDEPDRAAWLQPLRGATALACWCPLTSPCHADVLIELLS